MSDFHAKYVPIKSLKVGDEVIFRNLGYLKVESIEPDDQIGKVWVSGAVLSSENKIYYDSGSFDPDSTVVLVHRPLLSPRKRDHP